MFEKVLILTDFSEHARRILDCITGIVGIREIVLLHVIEDIRVPMGTETVEALVTGAAENSLQKEKRYLETLSPNLKITPELITSSDIAGTILETAEKNGADLIIISAYGMGMKAGLLTGNVPTAVLCRISRINVLVMRHKIIEALTGKTYEKFCPMIFSRILCPTNFSPNSDRAIALAGAMERVGEVILLHVVSPDEKGSEIQEAARTAEIRIGAIRDTLAAKGIRSRAIVKTGPPASEITGTAEEEDVSVIWISSYGKGCFHDFLLGSTVNDIVMNTKRPVIIIRALD
jgi:nucleotide-binding universal stress UspA family protein